MEENNLRERVAIAEKDITAFHKRVDRFENQFAEDVKEIGKDIKALSPIPIVVENLKKEVSALQKEIEKLTEANAKTNERLAHSKGWAAGVVLILSMIGGFIANFIQSKLGGSP